MSKNNLSLLIILGGLISSYIYLNKSCENKTTCDKVNYDKKIKEYKIIKTIINDFN